MWPHGGDLSLCTSFCNPQVKLWWLEYYFGGFIAQGTKVYSLHSLLNFILRSQECCNSHRNDDADTDEFLQLLLLFFLFGSLQEGSQVYFTTVLGNQQQARLAVKGWQNSHGHTSKRCKSWANVLLGLSEIEISEIVVGLNKGTPVHRLMGIKWKLWLQSLIRSGLCT